jgi:hypothetical protein
MIVLLFVIGRRCRYSMEKDVEVIDSVDRKLANMYIACLLQLITDLRNPPDNTCPQYERKDTFLTLTSMEEPYKSDREFLCEVASLGGREYDPNFIRDFILKENDGYPEHLKIQPEKYSKEEKVKINEEINTYNNLCAEIKDMWVDWYRQYRYRFYNYSSDENPFSLYEIFQLDKVIELKPEYPSELIILFKAKEEFDIFFANEGLAYKIDPIILKINDKKYSIDKLYKGITKLEEVLKSDTSDFIKELKCD